MENNVQYRVIPIQILYPKLQITNNRDLDQTPFHQIYGSDLAKADLGNHHHIQPDPYKSTDLKY